MIRFTDRTYRNDSKWCKITRDNQERKFTFALGDKGEFKAYHVDELRFKWCTNWQEAQERALYLMRNI